jgi:predicted dehydrogenase
MKKYRAAVIGTGFIGLGHVEALRRLGNVEVVAVCDSFNAKEKAELMHVEKYYYDYNEMLEKEDLDVVHVCTPNDTHYQITVDAMKAGVNVMCEKPLCLNPEEAEEMVKVKNETGMTGGINFHNRFYPMPTEMRQMVKEGKLGRIFNVHGGYVQDWMSKQTDYSLHVERENTGNSRCVADIGLHWADLAQNVTGSRIVEVMAQYATVWEERLQPEGEVETFSEASDDMTYTKRPINTEDHGNLMMRFDNGAIGTAVISQVMPGRKNKTDLIVSGTELSVHWDTDSITELWIGHRDKHNELATKSANVSSESMAVSSYPNGHVEGFPDAFKHNFTKFYASLENDFDGEIEYATFEDGLHLMKVLEGFYQSSVEGKWIKIPE